MGNRLELHSELLTLCPNVYFQPPSNVIMKYPCIVYTKSDKQRLYGSDVIHFSKQVYKVSVIDRNPDSDTADVMEKKFQYCSIDQYFTVDNLNHTVLTLHY